MSDVVSWTEWRTWRGPRRAWALVPAFAASVLLGLPPAGVQAADGPIRQRLKERWLQRQEQVAAPEARTERADVGVLQPDRGPGALKH